MKILLKACFATFIATVLVAGLVRAGVEVGKPAPDFTLKDIQGETHRLSDFKGKTVVLEWVNPECPFVQKHYKSENMQKLQKSAKADGVVWLTINSGHAGAQGDYDEGKARGWLKDEGASPAAYFRDQDGKVGKLYSAKTTPHLFVITPEGRLVYDGAIDSIRSAEQADIPKATNYVSAALSAVKAGQSVPTATSQPYGCTVKY